MRDITGFQILCDTCFPFLQVYLVSCLYLGGPGKQNCICVAMLPDISVSTSLHTAHITYSVRIAKSVCLASADPVDAAL